MHHKNTKVYLYDPLWMSFNVKSKSKPLLFKEFNSSSNARSTITAYRTKYLEALKTYQSFPRACEA